MKSLESIRYVVESVEDALRRCPSNSRRHSELTLVWHHLMDAYNLLVKGELTPENLQWAKAKAAELEL